MHSIYRDYVSTQRPAMPDVVIGEHNIRTYNMEEALDVAKLYLTALKQTCHCLTNRQLSKFDPIVGENSCQIRALHVILSPPSTEEIQEISSQVENLLKQITRHRSKPPKLDARVEPIDILKQLNYELHLSAELDYCLRSYILTVGKHFSMSSSGVERSGIGLQKIQSELAVKNISKELLERLIRTARKRMSEESIQVIQRHAEGTSDEKNVSDPYIVSTQLDHASLRASCALANFRVVLNSLCRAQIPILLRPHKEGSYRLYYQSKSPEAPPELVSKPTDPKQAIFVIEGFSDDISTINRIDLIDLCLANIAQYDQYSEPPEIRKDLMRYRELGRNLPFKIAHTHASTVLEEK